jgi:hypothetical protein
MAIFCLMNFSVWTHYFPAYLCLPFLGWVLWEALQLPGRWRRVLLAGAGVSFLFCSCDVPMRAAFCMLAGMEGANFYSEGISQPVYALLGPLFYLGVAFWRLFRAPTAGTKRAEQAPGILSWN